MFAPVARWVRRRGEPSVAVLVTGSVYLTIASLLVFRYHSINGDALSRWPTAR